MKVKCIKLINDRGEEVNNSWWLKINSYYYVIEIIYLTNSKRNLYRILDYNKKERWFTPFLIMPHCFEIVSTVVPSNWRIEISEEAITISPQKWFEDDFWGKFFDGDPESEELFLNELQPMFDEDPF